MSDESQDDDLNIGIFEEPEGFRAPEKPHTYQNVQLDDGGEYTLRLVGSNPLWGHHLWNGARVVSRYLLEHVRSLVHDKLILELGAGAGLPSLVCAAHGARSVVVTDYPDADLIENLSYNIDNCLLIPRPCNIVAKGYLWGAPVSDLKGTACQNAENGFDVVILADLLFNHSEHHKLMDTVRLTLARTTDARALVFFTPYRPWLLEKDLAFFDLVGASNNEDTICGATPLSKEPSLMVHKISEDVLDKVMFEEDRGDELLRRTVFGYELKWADLQP